jgi:sugar lactone lactonase YvrE
MHTFSFFRGISARSAAFSWRSVVAIAMLAVACASSSPAWCKPSASLWVADRNHNTVVEILPNDLKQSGTPTPVVLHSAAFHDVLGMAFDKSQNLWITNGAFGQVLEFTAAQLKNLGTVSNPLPTATIDSMFFNGTAGCTFDKHGNLWILNNDGKGVLELTQTQLNAGSNPNIVPAINITSTAELDIPDFGAFDKSGNLWVSSNNNSQIVKFTASQLGSSGDKAPAVILTSTSNSLDFPGQLVFDHSGNLWVSNLDNGTVVMFAKKNLRASGSPTPKVTLNSTPIGPLGLAFDSGHNLWVAGSGDGTIGKYTSKQLKKGGSPAPAVLLTGALATGNFQMTFGPVF